MVPAVTLSPQIVHSPCTKVDTYIIGASVAPVARVYAENNRDTLHINKVNARPRHTLDGMGKTLRRARGTGIGNVQVNYTIPPESKKILTEISSRMGISASEGLELILDHLDLESDGLPAWVDRDQLQEALPIAKAS